jgi:hypothetical protein
MYARSRVVAVAIAAASIMALSAAAWPEGPGLEVHQRHRAYYQARLDTILVELRTRDVSDLSQAQRANRARNIETLRQYRDVGAFPRNYDFDVPTPYFVDRVTGTLCAVAYLLDASGRRDIVDRVAKAHNNVWVNELSGDAEFRGWLSAQGLTLAEAARIQVPYAEERVIPEFRETRVVAPTSVALTATSLAAALWDRKRPGTLSRITSVVAGAGTIGVGVIGVTSSRSQDQAMGAATTLAGATAILLTSQRYMTDKRIARLRQTPEPAVNVAPTVSGEGAGLAMTIRF